MVTIKINHLNPLGSDLLQDSETFLNELAEEELDLVFGGDSIAGGMTQHTVSQQTVVNPANLGVNNLRLHHKFVTSKTTINFNFSPLRTYTPF